MRLGDQSADLLVFERDRDCEMYVYGSGRLSCGCGSRDDGGVLSAGLPAVFKDSEDCTLQAVDGGRIMAVLFFRKNFERRDTSTNFSFCIGYNRDKSYQIYGRTPKEEQNEQDKNEQSVP